MHLFYSYIILYILLILIDLFPLQREVTFILLQFYTLMKESCG